MKPILFMLNPGFYDGGRGPFFCPDTAYIEGFLSHAPELAGKLDIRHVDFQKPRQQVIALLGEASQSCPVYIFAEGEEAPPEARMSPLSGRFYLSEPRHIVMYLSRRHQTMKPHE